MDPYSQLYWLAGLLEGEGAISAGPPSSPDRPHIALQMTDRDIVERVATILGRATCRSDRGVDRGHKPVFITSIKGNPAVGVMLALRPALGRRRQAQIDRAVIRRSPRPMRWFSPTSRCGWPTCEKLAQIRALCGTHYKLWWKARRHGRTSVYTPLDAPPVLDVRLEPLSGLSRDDPRSIAWLAGLLEGEGHFGFVPSPNGASGNPIVQLQMCDEDVVRAAAQLTEATSIWNVQPRHANWSVTFNFRVSGPRAVAAMRVVRPYMGERRGRAIDLALERYRPIRLTEPPATCAVEHCAEPHRSRGLCHKHYMMWSRDRAGSRTQRITPLR